MVLLEITLKEVWYERLVAPVISLQGYDHAWFPNTVPEYDFCWGLVWTNSFNVPTREFGKGAGAPVQSGDVVLEHQSGSGSLCEHVFRYCQFQDTVTTVSCFHTHRSLLRLRFKVAPDRTKRSKWDTIAYRVQREGSSLQRAMRHFKKIER